MTRSRILGLVAVLAVAAIATGAFLFFFVFGSTPIEDRLKMARAEHRAGDYEAATELVDGVLTDAPNLVEARALSAQISIDARNDDAADVQISWLAANTASDTTDLAVNFAKQISKRYLDASDVDGAEKWFARVLEIDPNDGETTRLMADLLTDQGRRWEAYPLLIRLLKSGNAELMQLILVARTEGMMALDADYVAQRYADRGQVGPLLGLVRYGIATNGHKTAEELVHQVIAKRPEIIEARIRLCEIVLEVRPNEFAATIADVPANAVEHPDYWTLLGKWYRQKNEPAFAVACFHESLKLDPNRTIATFQLSQLLERLGRADDAAAFRNRADTLRDLASELTEFLSGSGSLDRVHKVSDHLEELGRYRESVAWAQNANQQGRVPWATKRISELVLLIS